MSRVLMRHQKWDSHISTLTQAYMHERAYEMDSHKHALKQAYI